MNLLAAAAKISAKWPVSVRVWLGVLSVFLVVELLPIFWAACPWEPLTGTVRDLELWWHAAKVLVALFLVALAIHLVTNVSARWIIFIAAGAAVGVVARLIVEHS